MAVSSFLVVFFVACCRGVLGKCGGRNTKKKYYSERVRKKYKTTMTNISLLLILMGCLGLTLGKFYQEGVDEAVNRLLSIGYTFEDGYIVANELFSPVAAQSIIFEEVQAVANRSYAISDTAVDLLQGPRGPQSDLYVWIFFIAAFAPGVLAGTLGVLGCCTGKFGFWVSLVVFSGFSYAFIWMLFNVQLAAFSSLTVACKYPNQIDYYSSMDFYPAQMVTGNLVDTILFFPNTTSDNYTLDSLPGFFEELLNTTSSPQVEILVQLQFAPAKQLDVAYNVTATEVEGFSAFLDRMNGFYEIFDFLDLNLATYLLDSSFVESMQDLLAQVRDDVAAAIETVHADCYSLSGVLNSSLALINLASSGSASDSDLQSAMAALLVEPSYQNASAAVGRSFICTFVTGYDFMSTGVYSYNTSAEDPTVNFLSFTVPLLPPGHVIDNVNPFTSAVHQGIETLWNLTQQSLETIKSNSASDDDYQSACDMLQTISDKSSSIENLLKQVPTAPFDGTNLTSQYAALDLTSASSADSLSESEAEDLVAQLNSTLTSLQDLAGAATVSSAVLTFLDMQAFMQVAEASGVLFSQAGLFGYNSVWDSYSLLDPILCTRKYWIFIILLVLLGLMAILVTIGFCVGLQSLNRIKPRAGRGYGVIDDDF